VGNSLTYVGNLPAVFSALSSSDGHPVTSDMIVKGGATLSQRVADGAVARAFAEHKYSALILQERGGDLICSFGPKSCTESQQAIQTLSSMGHENGASVVLLGTYQSDPDVSRQLIENESAAAAAAGIPYVEVSETLQGMRKFAPGLEWFYRDDMHPGRDLILLDAILLYKQFFRVYPSTSSFTVKAPIYTTQSGLTEALRAADTPPPNPKQTPPDISYTRNTVLEIVAGLRNRVGS